MEENRNSRSELAVSPEGHLYLDESARAAEQLPSEGALLMKTLFAEGSHGGLLRLGLREFPALSLPASFLFWQQFSRKFITRLCRVAHAAGEGAGQSGELPPIAAPGEEELRGLVEGSLLVRGSEYLDPERLLLMWQGMSDFLRQELATTALDLQNYLNRYNPRWSLVGRICFHLAENKKSESEPFAFLATYTTRLSHGTAAQHLPLQRALQEYMGEKDHAALLALLLPVQKMAAQSPFIKELVDSGAIFRAQTWRADEALRFLKEIPLMEACGIMVRVPNWWNPERPPRPKIAVKLGERQGGQLGLDALLDFDIRLSLADGQQLSRAEWSALMRGEGNLVKIKGEWVEIDREKLQSVLGYWEQVGQAADSGLTMAESLRLLAGAAPAGRLNALAPDAESAAEWSTVTAGEWLTGVLDRLRRPDGEREIAVESALKASLRAELRPYQQTGVQWLWLLYRLKLGGCLADDMGLGKTIQVISLILAIKAQTAAAGAATKTHLLVVPASLLGNWQAEIDRFAPSLAFLIAHSSASDREKLNGFTPDRLSAFDIVITTYAFIERLPWVKEFGWDLIVLDEAQQIKNPDTKQTRAVKGLKSEVRLILTGTPIENRLGDLWSLFDFTSPGLLGSAKQFTDHAKKENRFASGGGFASVLRKLTQPYILRRLKSDKTIIGDLPDKMEMQAYCSLTKEQVRLYQHAVNELKAQLETAEGIERRGLVLTYMMRFKQICNHPVQLLGYGEYGAEASGKFLRIKEICEAIAAKQEKVLVFTQFREVIPALDSLLQTVFGREGLTLHGGTAVKRRQELVAEFQQEGGPPFFVLSLKAGGTGLNLTRASHVIHFDRWWNPAVENQATDRAYRIGQKHPVVVHKFICRGTIEEKIDLLIGSKKKMSQEILEGGGELALTELSDAELLKLVSLDLKRACGDF